MKNNRSKKTPLGGKGLVIASVVGVAAAAAAAAVFFYYFRMSVKNFGGITGDLAGYFLQLCEIWMAAAAVGADIVLRNIR